MQKENPETKQLRLEHGSPGHEAAYLEDGQSYAIRLKTGDKIPGAVFHYCALMGKHYFSVGAGIYPIEEVYSHSLKGSQPQPPSAAETPLIH